MYPNQIRELAAITIATAHKTNLLTEMLMMMSDDLAHVLPEKYSSIKMQSLREQLSALNVSAEAELAKLKDEWGL